jgi:hypothetical protein
MNEPPPHDVPDRGPDIVVTAPRPIAFITADELKLLGFAQRMPPAQ